MRIWSIHPKYLDTKGLVALWRETLLAKHVLEGKTKGYKHHPQLLRFKNTENPVASINHYLKEVYLEAERRGFNFNKEKIRWESESLKIEVSEGQVNYETGHLLGKLKQRDNERYDQFKTMKNIDVHPLFVLVPGDIESWEIINN
jgi:hypothetical protein